VTQPVDAERDGVGSDIAIHAVLGEGPEPRWK